MQTILKHVSDKIPVPWGKLFSLTLQMTSQSNMVGRPPLRAWRNEEGTRMQSVFHPAMAQNSEPLLNIFCVPGSILKHINHLSLATILWSRYYHHHLNGGNWLRSQYTHWGSSQWGVEPGGTLAVTPTRAFEPCSRTTVSELRSLPGSFKRWLGRDWEGQKGGLSI